MKRFLAVSLALAFVFISVSAFAETDAKAIRKINDIRNGISNKNAIVTLLVLQNGNISGALNIKSNVTAGGIITALSNVTTGVAIFSNDLRLANSETLDNATDGEVRWTYDDNITNLTLKLESDNTATLNADNYAFRLDTVQQATNSAVKSTVTRDAFVMTDVTSNSVDGAREFWIQVASTLTRGGLINSSGLTAHHLIATNGTFAGAGTFSTTLACDETFTAGTTCTASNSFNIGAQVGGSFIVTNIGVGITNLVQYNGGIVTGVLTTTSGSQGQR